MYAQCTCIQNICINQYVLYMQLHYTCIYIQYLHTLHERKRGVCIWFTFALSQSYRFTLDGRHSKRKERRIKTTREQWRQIGYKHEPTAQIDTIPLQRICKLTHLGLVCHTYSTLKTSKKVTLCSAFETWTGGSNRTNWRASKRISEKYFPIQLQGQSIIYN